MNQLILIQAMPAMLAIKNKMFTRQALRIFFSFLLGFTFVSSCFSQEDGVSCPEVPPEERQSASFALNLKRILDKQGKPVQEFLLQDEDFLKQVKYGFILGTRDKKLRKTTEVPSIVWDKAIKVHLIFFGGKFSKASDCDEIENEKGKRICYVIANKKDIGTLEGWEKDAYLAYKQGDFDFLDEKGIFFKIGYSENTPSEVIDYRKMMVKSLFFNAQGNREKANHYVTKIVYKVAPLYLGKLIGTRFLISETKHQNDDRYNILSINLENGEKKLAQATKNIARELTLFFLAKQEKKPRLCSELAHREVLHSLCKDESVQAADIQILRKFLESKQNRPNPFPSE